MLAVWQAADDIDVYESGWTFDHFYPIFSDSAGPCLEGWTTLTRLQRTSTASGAARPMPACRACASLRAGSRPGVIQVALLRGEHGRQSFALESARFTTAR
jgi:hypothetical protein